ncbi:MAG: hypothetical protein IKR71_01180 [Bacteroidales bacterium]|nr:hypothetical protein [Bacteroidales bacterium]
MKRLLTFLLLVLLAQAVWAQNSTKLSYQAVVRNANNELVANVPVTVEVSILDATSGTTWYTETHSVTTNANGLITLMIGEGTPVSGNLKDVAWNNASIKTTIGAGGENIDNTTAVNAVPYALHADSARTVNREVLNEQIHQVTDQTIRNLNVRISMTDEKVDKLNDTLSNFATQRALQDTAAAIRSNMAAAQVNADWNATEGAAVILNKPTDLSAFTNTPGYVTAVDVQEAANIPTKVSAFQNDAHYVNKDVDSLTYYVKKTEMPDLSGYLTTETDPNVPDWAKAANKPAYNYSEIANTPDLSGYLTTESDPTVNDVTISFTQGNAALGSFTTNATTGTTINIPEAPAQVQSDWNATEGAAVILNKPTDLGDFTNTPGYVTAVDVAEAAGVPTKVSQLENDANYITAADIPAETDPTVKNTTITFTQGETTLGSFTTNTATETTINIPAVTIPAETDPTVPEWAKAETKPAYSYDEISGTPDLSGYLTEHQDLSEYAKTADVPTKVSELTNDVPFLTEHQDLSEYAKLADIPTVPTKVSELTNDVPFLTEHQDLSEYAKTADIPTKVSELTNDVPFLTEHQDLSEYAKTADVPTKVSQLDNDVPFLTEHQDLSDYAKKSEIPDVSDFLTAETDPTVKDATITFTQGTETLGSFTANAGSDVTIDIPAAPAMVQVQANWTETDESSAAFIKNKPTIPEVTEYNEACLSTTFCELVNTVNKLLTTVDSLKDVIANLNNNATPTVTTNTTVEFDHGKATVGGNVTNAGFGELTERGICYGTSENPTVEGSKVVATGTTTGAFTCLLSGLETDQKYYARAYATNAAGTTYGDNVEFTIYEDPQLSMVEVTVAATGTITAQANLAQEGINTITELGICWGTTEDIDPDNDGSTKVTAIALGDYTLTLEGEFTEGTYYVRAYAKTAEGVFTSAEYKTFTITAPVVASSTDHSVVDGAMQLNGTLTALGTPAATEIGVCYGPNGFPTIEAPNTKVAAAAVAEGPFTVTATDMTAGTYHARAYATYAFGTVYGNDIAFTVNAPTVTTGAEPVVDNEGQKVTVSGNVTNAGSAEVTKRGICYGTTAEPDTTNKVAAENAGTGTFSATLTDLAPGATYYARAYAVNAFGIAYGDDVTFQLTATTPEPVVTTGTATYNTADGKITAVGEVVSAGTGGEVTERGICYSVNENPTIEGTKVAAATAGIGEFSVTLTDLTPAVYHLRAYATNAEGTAYGEDVTVTAAFVCGTDKMVDIDGNKYNTVKIGTQCWMAENLRVKRFIGRNGDTLNLVADGLKNYSNGLDAESEYCYAQVSNASTGINAFPGDYELFYPWKTATTGQVTSNGSKTATARGLCPAGWHVPSGAEGYALSKYLDPSHTETNFYKNNGNNILSQNQLAIRLCAQDGHWHAYDTSGDNATGVGAEVTGYNVPTHASYYREDSPGYATLHPTDKEWHWNSTGFSAYPTGYVNKNKAITAEKAWMENGTLNMWTCYGNPSGACHPVKIPVYKSVIYCYGASDDWKIGYSVRCINDNAYSATEGQDLPSSAYAPTVSTGEITIEGNVVTVSGNVISAGSQEVTERGICYGTSANPTTKAAAAASGTGEFSVTLPSGLQGGVIYYARAYATNSEGTSYGEDVTFTLPLPEVATSTTTNISSEGIIISGEVTNSGASNITACGIYYGTTAKPATDHVDATTPVNSGEFSCSLPNTLLGNTTYYARAYATNSEGTAYGEDITFTLPMATVTTGSATMNGMNMDVTGEVTEGGITEVTARGICWGTSAKPTTQVAAAAGGLGEFTVSISGLENSVTYYLRAYATNAQGTVYGEDIQFTCTMPVPVVTTGEVTISGADATIAGEITDDGGSAITARGICWGTSENPTISDNAVPYAEADNAFSVTISGLSKDITYHARAYATNASGTGYGEDVEVLIPFQCGVDKLVDIDGNEYATTEISDANGEHTQCWMAENLRVKKTPNGTALDSWTASPSDITKVYSQITNKRIGNTSSGAVLVSSAVLYTWPTAAQRTSINTNETTPIQGICPTGWHLPSMAEYYTLCKNVDPDFSSNTFYGKTRTVSTYTYYPNVKYSNVLYQYDNTYPSSNQLGIRLCSGDAIWKAYASKEATGTENSADYSENSPGYAQLEANENNDWHWNTSGFNATPDGYMKASTTEWWCNGTLNLWTSYGGYSSGGYAQAVKISCYKSGVYTCNSSTSEGKNGYSVRCLKD